MHVDAWDKIRSVNVVLMTTIYNKTVRGSDREDGFARRRTDERKTIRVHVGTCGRAVLEPHDDSRADTKLRYSDRMIVQILQRRRGVNATRTEGADRFKMTKPTDERRNSYREDELMSSEARVHGTTWKVLTATAHRVALVTTCGFNLKGQDGGYTTLSLRRLKNDDDGDGGYICRTLGCGKTAPTLEVQRLTLRCAPG
ncbi:hypothetical protein QTP88_024205 [Uroleucon formosanum]